MAFDWNSSSKRKRSSCGKHVQEDCWGGPSGGAAGTVLQFYTEDAPGLKISPNVVFVLAASCRFINRPVCNESCSKCRRYSTKASSGKINRSCCLADGKMNAWRIPAVAPPDELLF